MKIIIHGGFFSESSQSDETKREKQIALQEALEMEHLVDQAEHFLEEL